ncbi:MAG: hypothetical protein V4654_12670 [Bdellovibrionota bacterium]
MKMIILLAGLFGFTAIMRYQFAQNHVVLFIHLATNLYKPSSYYQSFKQLTSRTQKIARKK